MAVDEEGQVARMAARGFAAEEAVSWEVVAKAVVAMEMEEDWGTMAAVEMVGSTSERETSLLCHR